MFASFQLSTAPSLVWFRTFDFLKGQIVQNLESKA